MKSTKETPETAQVSAAVRAAVEAAASRVPLAEARTKLADLRAKMTAEEEEIHRLEADTGEAQVQAALEGKPIQDNAPGVLLQSARFRLHAYQKAWTVQSKVVADLETKLYGEVTSALKPLRQPSVERAARALAELRNAASEDHAITEAVIKAGVRNSVPGLNSNVVADSPILRGALAEDDWLRHVRHLGYSV